MSYIQARELKKLRREQVLSVLTQYFNIEFPVEEHVFANCVRLKLSSVHPDKVGDEFREEFQQLQELLKMKDEWSSFIFAGSVQSKILTTTDGTPLTELGQGLGTHKNGVPCKECKGKGYLRFHTPEVSICNVCQGLRMVERTNSEGRSYIRICYVCNGKGVRWLPDVPFYQKCWKCKGKGETEIFNPVIPKGRLTA